jgi:hypothetical protein
MADNCKLHQIRGSTYIKSPTTSTDGRTGLTGTVRISVGRRSQHDGLDAPGPKTPSDGQVGSTTRRTGKHIKGVYSSQQRTSNSGSSLLFISFTLISQHSVIGSVANDSIVVKIPDSV